MLLLSAPAHWTILTPYRESYLTLGEQDMLWRTVLKRL